MSDMRALWPIGEELFVGCCTLFVVRCWLSVVQQHPQAELQLQALTTTTSDGRAINSAAVQAPTTGLTDANWLALQRRMQLSSQQAKIVRPIQEEDLPVEQILQRLAIGKRSVETKSKASSTK